MVPSRIGHRDFRRGGAEGYSVSKYGGVEL
jgi:hypothetical protein